MSLIGSDLVGEMHEYHMYPLVIVSDRYGGCYSHGKFTVWNCYPENIPDKYCSEYQLDLTECQTGQSHDVTALELLRGKYSYTSELRKTEDGLLIPNLTIEKYQKI